MRLLAPLAVVAIAASILLIPGQLGDSETAHRPAISPPALLTPAETPPEGASLPLPMAVEEQAPAPKVPPSDAALEETGAAANTPSPTSPAAPTTSAPASPSASLPPPAPEPAPPSEPASAAPEQPEDSPAAPIEVPPETNAASPDLRQGAATTQGPAGSSLTDALTAVIERAPGRDYCLAVHRGGQTVFARNAETKLVPASLQKLVLVEAALRVLGPDYTFKTMVMAAAEPAGGVLDGDLYLVGGGDPLLSTPHYLEMLASHGGVGTPLAKLADNLVAAGVGRLTGGVVAVADRYDTRTTVASWPDRYAAQSVAGSLSALSVDQGWRAPPGITSTWGLAPHPAPAQRAAEAFDDLLEARSVRIPLVPRAAAAGGNYDSLVTLATIESEPLSVYLHYLLAESDNTLAEMLLKELGLVSAGRGTTRAGAQAVQQALAAEIPGLATPADGSGLSPENRLSCSQIAEVLDFGGARGQVASALAVAGRSGTMENRYRNSPLAGLVRGKTGSLNGVAALAGFAEPPGGEPYNFVVILNSGEEWLDRDVAFGFFTDLLEILVANP